MFTNLGKNQNALIIGFGVGVLLLQAVNTYYSIQNHKHSIELTLLKKEQLKAPNGNT